MWVGLLAVSLNARPHAVLRSIEDMNQHVVNEITEFFVSYNRIHGKQFKVLGLHGPNRANALAREAIKRFEQRPREGGIGKGN
jgi:inorganic pyrophosphatase